MAPHLQLYPLGMDSADQAHSEPPPSSYAGLTGSTGSGLVGSVDAAHAALRRTETELRRVIVGQSELVDRLFVGLLCRGHLLIEGVPGLAKTLTVKSLARTLDLDFRRIQFTPDLLPADLLGTLIYDQRSGDFVPRQGPIFTQFLLADEINRAPAKVQSALLEAMEERQVTLGERTYRLEEPFMVLATQNPIEQEGTYPLAEAQVDRFLMKIVIDYPSRDEELRILDRHLVETEVELEPVLDEGEIAALQRAVEEVRLDDRLRGYVLDLVTATRRPGESGLERLEGLVAFGASPRATLFLARAAKALALLRGRRHVLPEDIKEIAPDILRHRIVPSFEAEAEGVTSDDLVRAVLDGTEVP